MTCVATAGRQVTQPPPPPRTLWRLNPFLSHRIQSLIFPFTSTTEFSAAQPELIPCHHTNACWAVCRLCGGKGGKMAPLALRTGPQEDGLIELKRFKCLLRNENWNTGRGEIRVIWSLYWLQRLCLGGFSWDLLHPPFVLLGGTSVVTWSPCLVCDPGRAAHFVRYQFSSMENEQTGQDYFQAC